MRRRKFVRFVGAAPVARLTQFDQASQFCDLTSTLLDVKMALQAELPSLAAKGKNNQREGFAMTKFALPALVLCVLALFSFSVASQSNDVPPDLGALRAELTQKLADAEKSKQDREQQFVKTIDSVRDELKHLSDDAKANSDKIAQTVMLRSELLKLIQDSKSSSDKATQIMLDQIDALRSDQLKFLKEAKETGDRTTQSLRQEVAASQAKLVAQVGDTLKANTATSEALAQRVDAMQKAIDDVKKNFEGDRQDISNISPGFALFAALAALLLGPFVAYQFTANQLAAAKRQAAAEAAAAAQPQTAKTTEAEPPLAPPSAAEQQHEAFLHSEAPALGVEASPYDDADVDHQTAPDSEKV
jgi:hypothetical protein